MKCPVCNKETGDMFCETCGKSIVDIYLKIIEDLQAERNYNKALEMLIALKNETGDKETLAEIKEIEEAILFSKVQSERTQDYESREDKNTKRINYFAILFIVFIIVGLNLVVWKIFIDKKIKNETANNSIQSIAVDKNMQIFSKFIFQDIADVIVNYKENIEEKDINGDGIKEIVAIFEKNYFVFSKENGGSLIYWYDLKNGTKLIGEGFESNNIKNQNHEKISGGDGFELSRSDMKYEVQGNNKIIFEGYGVKKEVILYSEGLEINYISTRTGGIEIKILLEPDFGKIYEKGLSIIKIEEEPGKVKAVNTLSEKEIIVEYGLDVEKIIYNNDNEKSLIVKNKNLNYKLGIKKSE